MLPLQFRFSLINGCGQTLAANAAKVYYRRKNLTVTKSSTIGWEAQLFEDEQTQVINAGTTAAAATASAASWIGHGGFTACECIVEVICPADASGNVVIYVDKTTSDTAATHASDAANATAVATVVTASSATKRVYFEF